MTNQETIKTTSQLYKKLCESEMLTFVNDIDVWDFSLGEDLIYIMKNARMIKISKNTIKTLEFILETIKTNKLEIEE
tara:strand:- start:2250 stop:2480 length:231 start_codon:yes stop_codon:yes gene_type:complete